VAALQALWDGDTVHDRFVLLVAVLNALEGREGYLAAVDNRPDGPPPGAAAAAGGRTPTSHLHACPPLHISGRP
jgi:hypothetical protein